MLEKEASRNLDGLEIGASDAFEMNAVVGVIARGMRDNPTHVAALGEDPGRREKRVRRIFSRVLPVMGHSLILARHPDGTILGVLGMAAPGRCQANGKQRMQLTLGLLPLGPRALSRSLRWVSTWENATQKSVTGTSAPWRWTPTCREWASARS